MADHPSYSFTLDSIAAKGTDRIQLEEFLEGWVADAGEPIDDVLDRLDGSIWDVDGVTHRLNLPDQTTDPVYVRLVGIARKVRRELL